MWLTIPFCPPLRTVDLSHTPVYTPQQTWLTIPFCPPLTAVDLSHAPV